MDILKHLVEHFQAAPSAPFLFVGSGFSRRYLGLEDWAGLLARFTAGIRPFDYYYSSAGGDMPTVASLMCDDFHELWWSSGEYAASRDKHAGKVVNRTSALRIEICAYLAQATQQETKAEYKEEIELLASLNVDGIITTNWDGLLESLFPDYKVFVGQAELLFSNPQSIGEIYKIHGSSIRPASLVLTQNDYAGFEAANPYLAAKLITLFVEHPVVFIGYSLADRNVASLLKAITAILGADTVGKLQNNLVFVQRSNGADPQYSKTYMTIEGTQLPITIVSTDSFVPIYRALETVKRKIPARILRYCKEQLYELVKNTTPSDKFHVVDVDEIEKRDDIEFVIGVGVATERASEIGYQAINATDLFLDLVAPKSKYDARAILGKTLPALGKFSKYIPVFRYLKSEGINSLSDFQSSGLPLSKHIPVASGESYRSAGYLKTFLRTERDKTAREIIDTNAPEKAAMFLPFLPREKFDGEAVRDFLAQHSDRFGGPYSTFFRKLACQYDYYFYGWG